MLIDKILRKYNIESLNKMQEAAGDAVLNSGKDVVVLSPTGSGKTLAYMLPLVQKINPAEDKVQAVIIVPGRELALQSASVLNGLGCGLRAMSCYGGRPAMDEHRMMRSVKPHLIFATPGRMCDHIDKGNVETDDIKYLVIDEFDKCLEMGFSDEMSALLAKLNNLQQRILLSATDEEVIPEFVNMNSTVKLNYLEEKQISDRIKVFKLRSRDKDKLETLGQLLRSRVDESSIVFLSYRDSVERVNDFLKENGFTTSRYHGGLDQKEREDAIYKFSNGSANVLVSTDLASRGLDIPDVDNVIHYHLPMAEEEFIHRTGRTARWDAKGRTFFILGPEENMPEYVKAETEDYVIPENLPKPSLPKMATIYIGKGKKDKIGKGDIVGFLCKEGELKGEEIGRIDVKERYAYVAVKREKLHKVLNQTKGKKIKGIKTVVESVR